jgi:hypothetical protein
MACLYINHDGQERTRHSYSAGLEFDHSPYKYWLHRVMGWRERDTNASLLFGRALEDAIQFYHETKGKSGEDEFIRLWAQSKDKPVLYRKKEVSWEHLLRCGREMMRLYQIRQPKLPIPMDTAFQRAFSKEVFPDNERYGGIEFYAKMDMLARAPWNHPMLPEVEWKPEYGLFRPVITDIKTSVNNLVDIPGIVGHDMQLRQYAWVRGKQAYNWIDVAFLWFTKCGHALKKGVSVTLLVDAGKFKAGDEAVVASVEEDGSAYLVGNDNDITTMNEAQGYREGTKELDTKKEAKARAAAWREANAVKVPGGDITRQRMQYNAGIVTWESAEDAGRIVASQIVRIVNAWEQNNWTNTFSIRFPHNDTKDPYFQAFVLRDNVFRDSMFEQRVEEDLNDYFDEPEEAE